MRYLGIKHKPATDTTTIETNKAIPQMEIAKRITLEKSAILAIDISAISAV